MLLSLVVAMTRNHIIGRDNALPWHLPDDLKFFRQITMGKPVIMGRKTHESIARPLPGRDNIVLTHDRHYQSEGCRIVYSLEAAMIAAQPAKEAMIIGGASLYGQALPLADRIYLTLIQTEMAGDTRFPSLATEWHEVWREDHPADDKHAYPFSFMRLEK